jgi:hypothetical protein
VCFLIGLADCLWQHQQASGLSAGRSGCCCIMCIESLGVTLQRAMTETYVDNWVGSLTGALPVGTKPHLSGWLQRVTGRDLFRVIMELMSYKE